MENGWTKKLEQLETELAEARKDLAALVKATDCAGCKHENEAGDMWPCNNCIRCMDDMFEPIRE